MMLVRLGPRLRLQLCTVNTGQFLDHCVSVTTPDPAPSAFVHILMFSPPGWAPGIGSPGSQLVEAAGSLGAGHYKALDCAR